MPDAINQWVVTHTPRIQAELNATEAVRGLWKEHRLASQQAFHGGNPFIGADLGTDKNSILPWMPDYIGNDSNKTGILVVGSSYAPVIRPEPIHRRGFRRCLPSAAVFKRLCNGGDIGHRQLYEEYFWRKDDPYYGKIGRLFDELFGDLMGKERIVLTDIVRASLVEVREQSVNSQEFSRNERRRLFCEYLDGSIAHPEGQGTIFNRIAAMLKTKERVAVVTLGWFAEYLVAAFMKERNGWTRSSPFEDEAMPGLCLDRVRGEKSLGYAAGRNLKEWLGLEAVGTKCWKWRCDASDKEVLMMPIYHPSKPEFVGNREHIVSSLREFLRTAGCLASK